MIISQRLITVAILATSCRVTPYLHAFWLENGPHSHPPANVSTTSCLTFTCYFLHEIQVSCKWLWKSSKENLLNRKNAHSQKYRFKPLVRWIDFHLCLQYMLGMIAKATSYISDDWFCLETYLYLVSSWPIDSCREVCGVALEKLKFGSPWSCSGGHQRKTLVTFSIQAFQFSDAGGRLSLELLDPVTSNSNLYL